ncbi:MULTISPECIES: MBL fold metallo-hydrolase [unclassified Neptuniibacter]|uniref:MBL fold metallo-hydrolase n=1 Tax=unclassified Neptuniibacter TaxID=2630693 RepID=UPI000C5D2ABE|nr:MULTISPECIES: MBL fold metallo-hydrolase [unclassified Neptuniibacter]MAY41098.1 MBL fold metallo-hydrolase [Oceanospirillaceae bacterium]|tara:strand:- start:3338 stop:4291 length:954 start_codon:yes stop_codon:yes gene_type:complete
MLKITGMLLSTFLLLPITSFASPEDNYPESLLYSQPKKVAKNVWTSIGATQYYSYENGGHNNNLSFVIGTDSILVVNGGSSYLLAKALHDEIKKISALPVKYVVDENGQSHAILGNGYWKEQGAKIIAHVDALEEVSEQGLEGLENLQTILKERAEGTELIAVDETFTDQLTLDLGGLKVELIHFGPAHSVGDISVFVPANNVLIAGDMAFQQRLLPIFPDTDTAEWLETWNNAFAPFAEDKIIIPGHGDVTDFKTVDQWTRGYLAYIRAKVAELLENDGSLEDAYLIDQSPYAHLETFDQLAAKNAGRVFEAMEFE